MATSGRVNQTESAQITSGGGGEFAGGGASASFEAPDPVIKVVDKIVYDDGSFMEIFSDGSRLVTNNEGQITYDDEQRPVQQSGGIAYPQAESATLPTQTAGTEQTRQFPEQTVNVTGNFLKRKDWRFRISLAKKANYFYKDPDIQTTDILYPLIATDGVIFPYTPSIGLNYSANYESTDLTHSNYKIYNYKNSSVENITITGDFTAQDTTEANYLLAVMHFFKTATKMFYGKDELPKRGIPPPLCYLHGHGEFAFNEHPVVIQSFNFTYPQDVDYINTHIKPADINLQPYNKPSVGAPSAWTRLKNLAKSGVKPGGKAPEPVFRNAPSIIETTRVPTKITLTVTVIPIVTRNNISNNFSLEAYARGRYFNDSYGVW